MDERLLRDAGNKSSSSSLLPLDITSIFIVVLKDGSSEILNVWRMFNLGNYLLRKPRGFGKTVCICECWGHFCKTRSLLQGGHTEHSEVQKREKAEQWLSLDWLHVLALSFLMPEWWMPAGGCHNCCAKAGGEWKRVWLCQMRSSFA